VTIAVADSVLGLDVPPPGDVFAVPVPVPLLVPVSVPGVSRFVLGASRTPVGADVAAAEPALLVAVTTTRNVDPASELTVVYVLPVSPGTSAHAPPVESHRRHWRANAIVGVPDQVPSLALSVWPTVSVPEMVGAPVFDGAAAATTAVGADVAESEPAPFVAVTVTRSVEPTSVDVTV
jgi:hypothetical protein